ncbi:Phenylalanine-specific permease [compost metagenome]
MIILIAQLKFRKAKTKEEVAQLKFKIPLYPFSTYMAIAFLLMVIVLMAFIPDMRVALYVAPVWFFILFIGYKVINVKK